MIILAKELALLNLTVAYRNKNFEFVNLTNNLIKTAGKKSEDDLLGTTDYDDYPWSIYADEYRKHDQDAFVGLEYSSIVPFRSITGEKISVLCTRYPWKDKDAETIGTIIYVVPIINPNINELVYVLHKANSPNSNPFLYINKNPSNIQLTNKESECLCYLVRGKTAKVIAKIMGISNRTVEFHINNLKEKFGCRSKAELISLAIQQGFHEIIPAKTDIKRLISGLKNEN